VASVLSMISGTPTSWATPATPEMSSTSFLGLPIDSPKNALVFGLAAERQASRSSASSTKVKSMPSLRSEWWNRLNVPPYSEAEATTWSPAPAMLRMENRLAD